MSIVHLSDIIIQIRLNLNQIKEKPIFYVLDSIIRNLIIKLISFNSSRRLEVSRVELLLQVGTFCVAVGALVAGTGFG